MDKELRRRQSILGITGIGVIVFGFWSFIKIHLYFLVGREYLLSRPGYYGDPNPTALLIITYIILLIIAAFDLSMRIYIGRNAVFEANNYHRKTHYVGAAMILIFFTLLSIFLTIISIDPHDIDILDQIASFLVDITSVSMLFELVSSSLKIRKIRNEEKAVRR
ncbi:MAG: hypothetical protein E7302_11225 [Butyrivibrio sp.]|nr:hypothetical protein [Butyrivibrio sp.]